MNCRQVDRLMVEYLYGSLSRKVAGAIEEHLTDCAACQSQFDAFRRNRIDLTALTLKRTGPSLARAAVHRWNEEENLSRIAVNSGWRLVGAAIATTCIVTPVVLVLWNQPTTTKIEQVHEPPPVAPPYLVQDRNPALAPLPKTDGANLQEPERRAAHTPVLRGVRHDRGSAPRLVNNQVDSLVDDMTYINADSVRVLNTWVRSVPMIATKSAVRNATVCDTDSFITIAPPRIASTDPTAIRAARATYQQEKATNDTRLDQKVDLAVKGIAFADLCRQLRDTTGITFHASRAIADEKVTVFCDQTPLREIMRQITHVFGYTWERSRGEGIFHYQLFQPLKLQLAEQALRDKDRNATLADLEKGLEAYKPLLELSRAELLERLQAEPRPEPVSNKEETPLAKAGGWGALVAVQMLNQLTPAESEALRNGQEVGFSTTDQPGHALLTPEMSASLLDTVHFSGSNGTFDKNTPGAAATLTLSIDQSELGQIALRCTTGCNFPGFGVSNETVLAIGRSPSTAKPDNRAANKGLEQDPDLQREVSLHPQSCKKPDLKTAYGLDFSVVGHIDDTLEAKKAPPNSHANTADVWEEIHKQTGMSIVADYYTHVFPTAAVSVTKKNLFDALCLVSDAMGVRWKKEGTFLQFRSTGFFWDKMKEVPNRLLDRWRKDRERNDSLPLDDLLEMAQLSDVQLNSLTLAQGVRHCLGLEEWGILDNPMTPRRFDITRPLARFLSDMPQTLRQSALQPEGIPVTALPSAQQEAFTRLVSRRGFQFPSWEGMRLHILYIPSGRYVYPSGMALTDAPIEKRVIEKTMEKAYAATKRIDPNVDARSIRRTYGVLLAILYLPDGRQVAIR